MTPIAIIEAGATLLWTYAALTFLAWARLMFRQDKGRHVAAVVELLFHLVPAMIALVLLVLVGAFIGMPSVVAFIALMFPAGLAYGTHMALTEARDNAGPDRPRIGLTILLASAIILYRQLL
ncbi:hypothetical protein [Jannaschia sp. CCS1]|uniref:hypothetical protein n=1 Tax=Jannaschia sp. (strain CCS1) TaxID=290400 RepID=UPI0002EFBC82|nr:hypothetical protein [Jannaschia sp. CCS1]